MADDLGFPDLDPRPDEDSWEAYLTFATPILGSDDALGLDNDQLTALETQLGAQLPFEIGLLLVMGIPAADGWWHWGDDPTALLEIWQIQVESTLGVTEEEFANAPKLLPLFEGYAVSTEPAEGEDSADSNPVLRIDDSGVSTAGLDLADWLHKQFDVPLPWWPENNERRFRFWNDATPRT